MKEIRQIHKPIESLNFLVFDFRNVLNKLNHSPEMADKASANKEVRDYFKPNRTVFGLYNGDALIGFSVVKEDDGCFWLEWIYIDPERRGFDNASSLFDFAEKYAMDNGGEKLYIWVHPENKRMLRFLNKKGYDSLNLIELTKKDLTRKTGPINKCLFP